MKRVLIQFSTVAEIAVGATQTVRISGLMVPVLIIDRFWGVDGLWHYDATSLEGT